MSGWLSKWRVRDNTMTILFLVTVVAFIDRANFSVAAPFIMKDLGINSAQMGLAMSAFLIGYGWFQFIGGILADKYGARKTLCFAIFWWSVFTALTGMAWGFISLIVIRFIFGVGESFHPPASFKSISVWFPKKERLRASSLFIGASALGPAIAPLVTVWCLQNFGWKGMFWAFSIPGFIMAWYVWKDIHDDPAKHPKMTQEELKEIYDGLPPASQVPKMSLWEACKVPGLINLSLIYLIFDISYWGFFSWLPSYLITVRKFAMIKMGIYASLPFLAGFIGLMFANTICNKIFRGNKIAFLITIWVLAAVSMYAAFETENAEMCIAFLSVTGFGIFTSVGVFWGLVTAALPTQAMGFLSSVINGAGKIGGAFAPAAIGALIQWTGGSYFAGFALMEICFLIPAVMVLFVKEKKDEASADKA